MNRDVVVEHDGGTKRLSLPAYNQHLTVVQKELAVSYAYAEPRPILGRMRA